MIITRSADKERRRVTRRPSSEVMSEVRSRYDRQKVLGYKRKLISSRLKNQTLIMGRKMPGPMG